MTPQHPLRCETCAHKNKKSCPMIAAYRKNCKESGEQPSLKLIRKMMEYHNETIKEHGCASHSAASRPASSPDTCAWKLNEDYGMYETKCGNAFECIEGDIDENNFKFCPYCGGRIKEIVEGAP